MAIKYINFFHSKATVPGLGLFLVWKYAIWQLRLLLLAFQLYMYVCTPAKRFF
jgi:hypothetical protein